MFFIVVDAHSKWPEVIQMSTTTSQSTMEVLRSLFSYYGLPEQIVLDNGAQFTSDEFAHFMKVNGIKHIRSAPYHPASNGLAERFVQTFKRAMKPVKGKGKHSIRDCLSSCSAIKHHLRLPQTCPQVNVSLGGHYGRGLICSDPTASLVLPQNKQIKRNIMIDIPDPVFLPKDSQ